jgi:hypothetical protein
MNTLNNSSVNRVAAGKLGAGRYDFKTNTEADLELDDCTDVDSSELDEWDDLEDEVLVSTSGKINLADHFTPEESAELMRDFAMAAKRVTGKRGQFNDKDDVASKALAFYMQGVAKGWEIRDHRAVMTTLVSRTAAVITQGEHDHWNRKAMNLYNKQVLLEEELLQRPLTHSEKKTVSEDVRNRWIDQDRLPAKDFHLHKATYSSLDAVDEDGYSKIENETGLRISLSVSTSPSFEGPAVRKALDIAEGVSESGEVPDAAPKGAKRSSAKFVWNAMAEISETELPTITENSISKRQRTYMLAAVKESGLTVSQIANQWENGIRNSTTAALFTPFGENTTDADQQNIVEKLMEHPEYADRLWNSVVTFVTRGH